MNIVIDTNVLISALKSNRGAAYKLLMLLPENKYKPCISVPLFIEYESVAKKQGLLSGLSADQIDTILDYFLSQSRIQSVFYLWRPFLKDPKDDLVLEVAVASASQYIVTFNKKDFKGCDKFNLKVVTPQEYMSLQGIL
jgi:putative PIN family toxin of toxin-antitoxin system